jgi:CBS domain-containing protein
MDLARNLKAESVVRLAPTPPRQVDTADPVASAVALMRRDRVGCVLVCAAGRLVGVFTERDYLSRILAAHRSLETPMSRVMTPDPLTIRPHDSISRAVRRMQRGGYRHLPVIDDDQRPVGILSVKRIVHYLVEHFPATVYNSPPDPHAVPMAREGA